MYCYRCKPALPFLPHSLYIITLVKTGTALCSLPVLLFLRAQYFSHPRTVVDPQTCKHKLCTHVFATPCPPLLPFLRPDLSHQVSWLGWNTLLFPRVIKSVLWNSPISTTLLYPPTLPLHYSHCKKWPLFIHWTTFSRQDLNQNAQGWGLKSKFQEEWPSHTVTVTQLSSYISLEVFLSKLLVFIVIFCNLYCLSGQSCLGTCLIL